METYLIKTQKFWAFIILPMINFLAWFMADPLFENITHIAYANHHFPFVLIWASTCAVYLWCYTLLLMKQIGYTKKSVILFLTLSCLFMIISVCIPYQAEASDEISHLHVNLSILATVTYIVLFLYLLCRLFYHQPLLWQRIIPPYLCIIVLLLLLLLLLGHISMLMETLFVMGMGIFHWWIQHVLQTQ